MDFINLMTYDLHGSYEGRTGQNSPLYASSMDTNLQLNQDACVRAWIAAGASPSKLLLGIGFYGRSYTLSNSAATALGAITIGAGKAGKYSEEPGMLTYLEICELQKGGGWTTVFDNEQKNPYTYSGNQWVGYDDVQSITLKAAYAKNMKLGGVMVWTVNSDDRANVCGQGEFPLMKAIRTELKLVRQNI